MTEKEKRLIENFIKRAKQVDRIGIDVETIGAIIAMIYDIWKSLCEVNNKK